MEEDILEQDEDLIEDEMKKDLKGSKETLPKESPTEEKATEPTKIEETYEGFRQEERLGIVNTLTGEVIDGFDPKKDEGLIKLGKVILNHLNKISITLGGQ